MIASDFRWNDWNTRHATGDSVTVEEIEATVRNARPPYPEAVGDGKSRVVGRGRGGRMIQVVFILDDDGTVYVIHARPVVKADEKRRARRRGK